MSYSLFIGIGSQLFENAYFRYYVNTDYFPLPQLAYYVAMLVLGFSFIQVVNLKY